MVRVSILTAMICGWKTKRGLMTTMCQNKFEWLGAGLLYIQTMHSEWLQTPMMGTLPGGFFLWQAPKVQSPGFGSFPAFSEAYDSSMAQTVR
mmetsp:Transcript_5879/g.8811  ORF Transcript_5879/g.8811 Transcript_5879/m.8811 type:complete len:92 (+) Transcript_5879:612-887(+)